MKRFFTVLTVFCAAAVLTACTKCTQDKPVEPPPAVVEPVTPPPAEGAMPGDVSAAPSTEEAPVK